MFSITLIFRITPFTSLPYSSITIHTIYKFMSFKYIRIKSFTFIKR